MNSIITKVNMFFCLLMGIACSEKKVNEPVDISYQPLMVGEVTASSAIFHARLTAADTLIFSDIHNDSSIAATDLEGKAGWARFEYAQDSSAASFNKTPWLQAKGESDFIAKKKISNLKPNSRYYYRLRYGIDTTNVKVSRFQYFKTLPSKDQIAPVKFVIGACGHFERFYLGGGFGQPSAQGKDAYRGNDEYLGFHAYETIEKMQPDFFISNGDNVYYDHPVHIQSGDVQEMWAKWHRQFSMPRLNKLFSSTPVYWLKDDHDHRFDDSDTVKVNDMFGSFPSNEQGIETFVLQVPVTDPEAKNAVTYRTYKVGQLLQIWMLEGRDFRSPNALPDGPGKSLWGIEQKEWLQQTLLDSDASYKLIVSPTPMVGPDDASKSDNHVNHKGFRTEGDEFFQWLSDNKFLGKNLYLLCGDRHWQYHAVHPSGFEEFSSGALIDQNARLGRISGDPKSSDPQGLVEQPYLQPESSGGFLMVEVVPANAQAKHSISFTFYDELGNELYKNVK